MELLYDSPIGSGSSAEVWLATDSASRRVAVKFFRGNTPDVVEQEAERHARALGRLDHPAVVRLYALERQTHPDDGSERLAVVMEYVEGTSLARCARDLAAAEAVTIVDQLVAGLAAFHAAGLVHGDFHDGNVMITSAGAKIIDPLYTHSLREVGTRTAQANVQEDLRQLTGMIRQVLEKNPIARRISSRIHQAYCQAIAQAKAPQDVKHAFQYVLNVISATTSSTPEVDPQSLKWYFLHDEYPGHRVDTYIEPTSADGLTFVRVLLRGYMDFDSNAKYLACYLPSDSNAEPLAIALIRGLDTLLDVFRGTEMILSHKSGTEPPRLQSELQFTGRLFLYIERRLAVDQRTRIEQFARAQQLFPHVLDISYAEMRTSL